MLNIGDIGVHDPLRIARAVDASAVEPQRLVAEPIDETERVRHQQDCLAAAFEVGELIEALVRESLVTDSEDFVHEQYVGIDVNRDGKPEPHVHA